MPPKTAVDKQRSGRRRGVAIQLHEFLRAVESPPVTQAAPPTTCAATATTTTRPTNNIPTRRPSTTTPTKSAFQQAVAQAGHAAASVEQMSVSAAGASEIYAVDEREFPSISGSVRSMKSKQQSRPPQAQQAVKHQQSPKLGGTQPQAVGRSTTIKSSVNDAVSELASSTKLLPKTPVQPNHNNVKPTSSNQPLATSDIRSYAATAKKKQTPTAKPQQQQVQQAACHGSPVSWKNSMSQQQKATTRWSSTAARSPPKSAVLAGQGAVVKDIFATAGEDSTTRVVPTAQAASRQHNVVKTLPQAAQGRAPDQQHVEAAAAPPQTASAPVVAANEQAAAEPSAVYALPAQPSRNDFVPPSARIPPEILQQYQVQQQPQPLYASANMQPVLLPSYMLANVPTGLVFGQPINVQPLPNYGDENAYMYNGDAGADAEPPDGECVAESQYTTQEQPQKFRRTRNRRCGRRCHLTDHQSSPLKDVELMNRQKMPQDRVEAPTSSELVPTVASIAAHSTLNCNAAEFRPQQQLNCNASEFRPSLEPIIGARDLISQRRRRQRLARSLGARNLREQPPVPPPELTQDCTPLWQTSQQQPYKQARGLLPTPDMPPCILYSAPSPPENAPTEHMSPLQLRNCKLRQGSDNSDTVNVPDFRLTGLPPDGGTDMPSSIYAPSDSSLLIRATSPPAKQRRRSRSCSLSPASDMWNSLASSSRPEYTPEPPLLTFTMDTCRSRRRRRRGSSSPSLLDMSQQSAACDMAAGELAAAAVLHMQNQPMPAVMPAPAGNTAAAPPTLTRQQNMFISPGLAKRSRSASNDLRLVPQSIQKLYRLVCAQYSDYSFIYTLSAQLCQHSVPMDCQVYLKMSLLISLNSIEIGEVRPPISLCVICHDTKLAHTMLRSVGQLAPRFVGPHEGGQQQPSALPSRYNWQVASPLVLAQNGVYLAGDWNRLTREHSEELEKSIENGSITLRLLQLEQPLEAAIWTYWQPENASSQTADFVKLCPIFGLPIYMDASADDDSLWNFMLRQHSTNIYHPSDDDFIIPDQDLRDLLCLLQHRETKFQSAAQHLLQKYYVVSRIVRPTVFSSRTYVVLKQFAESIAKLALRTVVLEADVVVAIFLCENFMQRMFGGATDAAAPELRSFKIISHVDAYMNHFARWLFSYLDDYSDEELAAARRARANSLDFELSPF